VDITQELPTVISFCSGYGGIERGLDLIGFEHRVIAYVEIEAYAIANLVNKMEAGLLPSAPIYTNLKTFPAHLFRDKVSLITGGYPCQPFSAAGQRKGTDDPRHLWPYIRRHIETIRPLQCFLENVEGHISLGLSSVVSDLEEDSYRTTWGIFSAREVGAPHQRKRVYILADSNGVRCDRGQLPNRVSQRSMEIEAQQRPKQSVVRSEVKGCSGDSGENKLADTISARSEIGLSGQERSNQERHSGITHNCGGEQSWGQKQMHWTPEPRVGRVVNGCPDRVDRIRMLGNGVVPQTAGKAWVTLNKRFNQ
jgi:DNA (cytosine-5)-methyltransferase 1